MSDTNGNAPQNERPPLGQTVFLGGICIVLGSISFLVGAGAIPSGSAKWSASGALIGMGAGLLFILAGIMVVIRDLAGAKNKEEIPESAPLALRLAGQLIAIACLVLFAAIGTIISIGPFFAGGALPDLEQQMGNIGAAIFRILNGAIALVLWYAAFYVSVTTLKKLLSGRQER